MGGKASKASARSRSGSASCRTASDLRRRRGDAATRETDLAYASVDEYYSATHCRHCIDPGYTAETDTVPQLMRLPAEILGTIVLMAATNHRDLLLGPGRVCQRLRAVCRMQNPVDVWREMYVREWSTADAAAVETREVQRMARARMGSDPFGDDDVADEVLFYSADAPSNDDGEELWKLWQYLQTLNISASSSGGMAVGESSTCDDSPASQQQRRLYPYTLDVREQKRNCCWYIRFAARYSIPMERVNRMSRQFKKLEVVQERELNELDHQIQSAIWKQRIVEITMAGSFVLLLSVANSGFAYNVFIQLPAAVVSLYVQMWFFKFPYPDSVLFTGIANCSTIVYAVLMVTVFREFVRRLRRSPTTRAAFKAMCHRLPVVGIVCLCFGSACSPRDAALSVLGGFTDYHSNQTLVSAIDGANEVTAVEEVYGAASAGSGNIAGLFQWVGSELFGFSYDASAAFVGTATVSSRFTLDLVMDPICGLPRLATSAGCKYVAFVPVHAFYTGGWRKLGAMGQRVLEKAARVVYPTAYEATRALELKRATVVERHTAQHGALEAQLLDVLDSTGKTSGAQGNARDPGRTECGLM